MVASVRPTHKSSRVRARIGAGGRLVIPAEIRRQLGLEEGTAVVMHVEDGELRLLSVRSSARRAQEHVMSVIAPGTSMADELLAERRAEAARE